MSAVIKQPDCEKFAIKSTTEIYLWNFLACYETLTHFAASCRINKRNYEMVKKSSTLSWEISFQRSTSAK